MPALGFRPLLRLALTAHAVQVDKECFFVTLCSNAQGNFLSAIKVEELL